MYSLPETAGPGAKPRKPPPKGAAPVAGAIEKLKGALLEGGANRLLPFPAAAGAGTAAGCGKKNGPAEGAKRLASALAAGGVGAAGGKKHKGALLGGKGVLLEGGGACTAGVKAGVSTAPEKSFSNLMNFCGSLWEFVGFWLP